MILRKFIFCTYFFTCKVDIIIVPFEDYMTLYVQVLRTAPDTESAHYFSGYKNKLFLFPWLMGKKLSIFAVLPLQFPHPPKSAFHSHLCTVLLNAKATVSPHSTGRVSEH